MKKAGLLIVIILLITVSMLGGYSLGREAGIAEGKTFYAVIDDIRGGGLTVIGLDENDINHRGAFRFSMEEVPATWRSTDIMLTDLQVGDVVAVTYTGFVQETDPAGLTDVRKVELLSDWESGWALAVQCKIGETTYTYKGEMVDELPSDAAAFGSVPEDYEGNCEGSLYGTPEDLVYFQWTDLSEYAWKHPYLILEAESASE